MGLQGKLAGLGGRKTVVNIAFVVTVNHDHFHIYILIVVVTTTNSTFEPTESQYV